MPRRKAPAEDNSPVAIPDIDVVETYFDAMGATPGVGFNSTVLDHRYFIDEDKLPQDSDGNLAVEFRFVSMRSGQPEKAAHGGFVPALVNSRTRTLDLDEGKPVIVGPPVSGSRNMQLYVRKKEHAEMRRDQLKSMVIRHAESQDNRTKEVAKDLGLSDNLTAELDSRELSASR